MTALETEIEKEGQPVLRTKAVILNEFHDESVDRPSSIPATKESPREIVHNNGTKLEAPRPDLMFRR